MSKEEIQKIIDEQAKVENKDVENKDVEKLESCCTYCQGTQLLVTNIILPCPYCTPFML